MDSKYLTMASKLAVGCLVLVDITYKNLDKSGVATASHLASYLGILGVQARRKPPSVDISLTITMFCCIEVQLKKRRNTLGINTKSHELPKYHGVFLGFSAPQLMSKNSRASHWVPKLMTFAPCCCNQLHLKKHQFRFS